MPANPPIPGETPYNAQDVLRDISEILTEIPEENRESVAFATEIAKVLSVCDPNVAYEVHRYGNNIDLLAFVPISGDWEVVVSYSSQHSDVQVVIAPVVDLLARFGITDDPDEVREVLTFQPSPVVFASTLINAVEDARELVGKHLSNLIKSVTV